jgi:AcrR family transcriptional regulator
MPRTADPLLEKKIVRAAQALFAQHGGDALTMRAVAKAAGTTTPTVYQRFTDREAILAAIRADVRKRLAQEMERPSSVEDACRGYLSFALQSPYEYELLMTTGWRDAVAAGYQGPVFEAAQKKLAGTFGGDPKDHAGFAIKLWCLLHGAATVLIAAKREGNPDGHQVANACLSACKTLLDSQGFTA